MAGKAVAGADAAAAGDVVGAGGRGGGAAAAASGRRGGRGGGGRRGGRRSTGESLLSGVARTRTDYRRYVIRCKPGIHDIDKGLDDVKSLGP